MPQGPLDEPRDYSGDRGWRGVNMRLEPASLEPGYCSEAINMRFRDGIAETRLGSVVVPWLNRLERVAEIRIILDTSDSGILDTSGAGVVEAGSVK
jgi:hypothetical protein